MHGGDIKKKILLIVVSTLVFIAIVFGLVFYSRISRSSGILRIVAKPAASVFIDNVLVGKSTLEKKLRPGIHGLKLIPESTSSALATWQKDVLVTENTITFVDVDLGASDIDTSAQVFTLVNKKKLFPWSSRNNASLYIETEPSGALFYINNEEKGITSVSVESLVPGEAEISVFMPKFKRQTKKVTLVNGYELQIFYKLSVDPEQKDAYVLPEPDVSTSATPSAGVGSADTSSEKIVIIDTPTGWLRVREEPTVSASESARVLPGQEFSVLETEGNWYLIEYDKEKRGWISSEYTEKK